MEKTVETSWLIQYFKAGQVKEIAPCPKGLVILRVVIIYISVYPVLNKFKSNIRS